MTVARRMAADLGINRRAREGIEPLTYALRADPGVVRSWVDADRPGTEPSSSRTGVRGAEPPACELRTFCGLVRAAQPRPARSEHSPLARIESPKRLSSVDRDVSESDEAIMAGSTGEPSEPGQPEYHPVPPAAPPRAPFPPPTKRPPTRSWSWLALVVFLAGLGWLGWGLYRLADQVDSLQRVAFPGQGEVNLDRGDYVIYYERPGAAAGNVPNIDLTVTPRSPSAAVQNLDQYSDSVTTTYNWG